MRLLGEAKASGGGDVETVTLDVQRQELAREGGRAVWRTVTSQRELRLPKTALVIVDMWDRHWSRGASGRVEPMVPRVDAVARAVRASGGLVIHAPSDTMKFYKGTPARRRAQDAPRVDPPAEIPHRYPHGDPPLPVDASDGGSDTNDGTETVDDIVWTREHSGIWIDPERDAVSEDGLEHLALHRARGTETVLVAGVHTNMCVLGRPFAIKQLVRWGMDVVLLRDLTDTMYNPAMPPYVGHDEGTRLVVEYIEKFWCPTAESAALLA